MIKHNAKNREAQLAKKVVLGLTLATAIYVGGPAAYAAEYVPPPGAVQTSVSYTTPSSHTSGYVLGGYDTSTGGTVGGNTVVITNGAQITSAQGGIGQDFDMSATGKNYAGGQVHTGNTYIAFAGAGIYSENSDVTNNRIEMHSGSSTGNLIGGISYQANSYGNSALMTGGSTTQDLVGGAAGKDAYNNTVTMTGGTVAKSVIGGQGEGKVYNNRATITGGTTNKIMGGYSKSGSGTITNNHVVVDGGTVTGMVAGGVTTTGSANENTVTINGGTLTGADIIGGQIDYPGSGTNTANDNTITVNKGNLSVGVFYGGIDSNLNQKTDDLNYIARLTKGNKLVTNAKNITTGGIYNFDLLNTNFKSARNGDVALTVTGADTELANTTIKVGGYTEWDSPLQAGDTLTVINGAVTNDMAKTSGTINRGVSLGYDLVFTNDGTRLYGTLKSPRLLDQTSVIPYNQVAQSELVNTGADAIDGALSSLTNANQDKVPWVNLTQKRGSLEDMDSVNTVMNIGYAMTKQDGDTLTTVAPFIEMGTGNYTVDNPVRADGDTKMIGVGVLYKKFNEVNGNYFNAAARLGHIEGKFRSSSFEWYDNVNFKGDGMYYAAQLKVGNIHAEGDYEFVDTYAGLYFSHTPGETATLSSGEVYDFDAINSAKLRVGVRHNRDTGRGVQFVGVGVEHEFAGGNAAHVAGFTTKEVALRGTTAFLEVGYRQDVNDDHKIGHDVSLKAYGGIGGAKRTGIELSATIMGRF